MMHLLVPQNVQSKGLLVLVQVFFLKKAKIGKYQSKGQFIFYNLCHQSPWYLIEKIFFSYFAYHVTNHLSILT